MTYIGEIIRSRMERKEGSILQRARVCSSIVILSESLKTEWNSVLETEEPIQVKAGVQVCFV